jgi:arylsulfatase
MTGLYAHQTGIGHMMSDNKLPGFRGKLQPNCVTIAEVLGESGYRTYMSGKWHVTADGNFKNVENPKPNGSWPTDRGFDEYYGGLSGGGDYYDVKSLMRNETHITEMPEDYYYTTAITENAVSFINMHETKKPFFLYLAHYAPHRPMQAPQDRIDACRDRYTVGYDVLRQKRYERMHELGILKSDSDLPVHAVDFNGDRPAWDSLPKEKKEAWITEMSTFSAMVEIMDDGIGEVVEALKARGMYNNTLVLFMSDNGATAEGGEISQLAASLSNTPYRMYKQFTHFGGISSPLIVRYPARLPGKSGTLNHTLSHIIDIMPTCLDFAGIKYPDTFKGETICSIDGISLLPSMGGETLPDRNLYFEHQTACSIISEGWKLVRVSVNDPWELYHLTIDPFEQTDVAKSQPEIAQSLLAKWTEWAEANNVFPLEPRPWRKRVNYYTETYPDQDGID